MLNIDVQQLQEITIIKKRFNIKNNWNILTKTKFFKIFMEISKDRNGWIEIMNKYKLYGENFRNN